jgi:hypothetical protein
MKMEFRSAILELQHREWSHDAACTWVHFFVCTQRTHKQWKKLRANTTFACYWHLFPSLHSHSSLIILYWKINLSFLYETGEQRIKGTGY